MTFSCCPASMFSNVAAYLALRPLSTLRRQTERCWLLLAMLVQDWAEDLKTAPAGIGSY